MLELNGSIPAVLAFASGKEGSNHDHTVLMVAAEGYSQYSLVPKAGFRLIL